MSYIMYIVQKHSKFLFILMKYMSEISYVRSRDIPEILFIPVLNQTLMGTS